MARIRSIKPTFFKHEELFDAEQESGLPLRLAFAGLWTQADREGRFRWRPRQLKTDILPYDEVDFSRVLHALATRGFVVRYASGGDDYGFIPSWHKHQIINNRESASELPDPTEGVEIAYKSDACPTRAPRDGDACSTPLKYAQAEREGEREREKEKEEEKDSAPNGAASLLDSLPEQQSHQPAPQTQKGGGLEPNPDSDEAQFWALATELEAKGVKRSRCGALLQALGDVSEALEALQAVSKAREPGKYLGGVLRRHRQNGVGIRGDPNDPQWVREARDQGGFVERDGENWRMGGALYDAKGEQVGW